MPAGAPYASYATPGESFDAQDLGGRSLNLSSMSTLDGQDPSTAYYPAGASEDASVYRAHSEDTVNIFDRSALLAQRARVEVAELLDVVNTGHPQWVG